MLRTTRCIKLTTFFALAVLLAAPLYAAPATGGVADVLLGTTQVDWVPTSNSPMVSYSLVVSGPDGVVERNFEADETPTFNLAALAGDVDGSYSWQLTATPELSAESRRLMAEARAAGTTFSPKDLPPRDELIQSGHFRVMDGAIVQPSATPEPSLGIATGGEAQSAVSDGVQFVAAADQVIPDDLIVQRSLCVGFDCANGETFGFDTIRLKENNLRIKFEDTSAGSFPTTDWQITINDSANGGASYYRIEDITSSTVPFTIEANTPNNTLYVDSTGRIGVGTNLPVVEIHVQDGDSPTLRLQQDTSSGFGAQTWDVAGNEANFFVRDTTNGSRLPFRIRPGAPTSSIDIAANGNVGMGTASPEAPLHVLLGGSPFTPNADTAAVIQQTTTGEGVILSLIGDANSQLAFGDTGDEFAGRLVYDHASNAFRIFTNGSEQARLESDGDLCLGCTATTFDLEVADGGTSSQLNAGDTNFTVSSSRSLKENLSLARSDNILDLISEIEVYEYDFIDGPKDRLGLMAEDFHRVFERGSDKLLSGQEVQMALWLAVQELARQNRELQERLMDIEGR